MVGLFIASAASASGGMGEVWEAPLDRTVAIEICRAALARSLLLAATFSQFCASRKTIRPLWLTHSKSN